MTEPARPPLLELTSTRFLAAMSVLVGHLQPYGLPQWLGYVTGGFGVSFFFVLSGFILCYVYAGTFAGGVEKDSYRRFAVARFARVYPCYALALLLLTAAYFAMGTKLPENAFTSWLANFVAVQTFAPSYETQQHWNAPAWSISTEFVFYALCPFVLAGVVRYARDRTTLWGLLLLTIAYAVIAQTLILLWVLDSGRNATYWLDLIASRNIVFRMPEFLLGVLAARLLFGGHLPILEKRGARDALLLGCAVAVLVINVAPWPPTEAGVLIVRQYRWNVVYMIPFAGIITALAAGPTAVSGVLKKPAFVFLGEISYAIYIYHWIAWALLAYALNSGQPVDKWWALVAIVAVTLFSAASYVWYERPVRRWIRAHWHAEK